MLDTIALSLNQTEFEVLDMGKFSPSAQGLFVPPYYPLGARSNISCYQNPTKTELSAGNYKPRLTLTKRRAHIGYAITLRIEFSAPKLVFGNNFDELCDTDFDRMLDILQRKLASMGVRVRKETLRNAQVSAIHYSKNMRLVDHTACTMILGELSKVNLNQRLDLCKTDYRNAGHAIRYHANSYELVFYDKIKDMQQAKNSEKRAIESDYAIQRDLFALRAPKLPEVLRMELRIGNRTKLKNQLRTLGMNCTMNFANLFNQGISQAMLRQYWDRINAAMPLQALSHFDPQDIYYAMMVETKGKAKPAKLLQRIGALAIIHNVGMSGLHSLVSSHSDKRTSQRLKRELNGLNTHVKMHYNAMRQIGIALAQFAPLCFEQKLLRFEGVHANLSAKPPRSRGRSNNHLLRSAYNARIGTNL